MPTLMNRFRQQPVWLALIITIALVLWIISGMVSGQTESAPATDKNILPGVQTSTSIALADPRGWSGYTVLV